jgi:hypothetical protein
MPRTTSWETRHQIIFQNNVSNKYPQSFELFYGYYGNAEFDIFNYVGCRLLELGTQNLLIRS